MSPTVAPGGGEGGAWVGPATGSVPVPEPGVDVPPESLAAVDADTAFAAGALLGADAALGLGATAASGATPGTGVRSAAFRPVVLAGALLAFVAVEAADFAGCAAAFLAAVAFFAGVALTDDSFTVGGLAAEPADETPGDGALADAVLADVVFAVAR